jgi:ferredoxin
MVSKLKYIRLIVALFFFIIIALAFLNIPALTITWALTEITTNFQIVPSLLRSTLIPITGLGFVIVLMLTIFYGRVYCSAICPLGIFQDLVSRAGKKFRKLKIYRYSKPHNLLRYTIFILVLLSLFTGSIFSLNLLDPYSIFGKIWSDLFRPVVTVFNDSISAMMQKFGSYALSPVGNTSPDWPVPVYSFILLLTVVVFSFSRGRLFCNTICPVGSFLSLVSRISVFKIQINEISCTKCGKCSSACKSECIDIKSKKVDFDRCVGCFNCIHSCPEKSIDYKKAKFTLFTRAEENKNIATAGSDRLVQINSDSYEPMAIIKDSRRRFLKVSILVALAVLAIKSKAYALNSLINFRKKYIVTPPGSYSLDNYKKHCTACHLCVSACPTQVLQPSVIEYGIAGVLQPFMDYNKSYCNYECVKCTEVCPTGAILPISPEIKKSVQIGKVIFLLNNCIVYTKDKSCGACAEHCPTKAVRMVSYKGALTIPFTEASICVGCGACEYACPAEPYKAIYVEGNPFHLTAFKYKEEKIKESSPQDFPF